MSGAFVAWMPPNYSGLGYWRALLIAPLALGVLSMGIWRVLLSRIYRLTQKYSTSPAPLSCGNPHRQAPPQGRRQCCA